jgi:hypothetical protein
MPTAPASFSARHATSTAAPRPSRAVPSALRPLALCALALACACGGPEAGAAAEDDLATTTRAGGAIAAQGFVHGAISDSSPALAYSFSGAAGDTIAADVWPSAPAGAQNPILPTLTLYAPKAGSKRARLADGGPRLDPRHRAIDGFKLPQTGSYLLVVAQAGKGMGGAFTLRLWSQASHAPRSEKAQLDLAPKPSALAKAAIAAHQDDAGPAWSDAEVAGLSQAMAADGDGLEALSDALVLSEALSEALASGRATQEQVAELKAAALALLGTPAQFAARPARQQAFALASLGALFVVDASSGSVAADAGAASALSRVNKLIAGWGGGAALDPGLRLERFSSGGLTYGFTATWSATQKDPAGIAAWQWFSTDWFDRGGGWLGEQSAGASEPEDD